MSKKIIIAGGGTGGHIFPAIAIANAIKKMDSTVDILFVGARGRMEMEKVPQAGYSIKGLDIAGFNRSSLLKNITLPFKLVNSFFQVKKIFSAFAPQAVIGVGGYSSFPVLRYAQSKSIPTFIHESNSFAGKSNKLLGKKATKVFVATAGMEKFFPSKKIMVTGNPVRISITRNNISREEGIAFFRLDPTKKTILVTGGSLGANSINQALSEGLEELKKNELQLIWQTGKSFAEKAKKAAAGKSNIWTNDFISQMEYAFAAADIVISRSGAMAIAELCVVKKPVVLVPYPFAAEDHQLVNALHLVQNEAGILVKDANVSKELLPVVIELAANQVRQQQLKVNIGKLAVTNADEIIAKEIMKSIA